MHILRNLLIIALATVGLTSGLTLLTLAAGCAHTAPTGEGCQELDWYEVGRQDGSRGITDNNQRAVKVLCDDTDQSLSEAVYQNGFDAGVAQFCTRAIAFEQGRLHQTSSVNICPIFLREDFTSGYNRGVKFAQLQQTQKEISKKIESIEDSLKSESIDQIHKELLANERVQLQQQKQALESEITQTDNSKQL